MAPVQNVNSTNTQNSPKKSKKRNKKNRHSSEKELEVKVVNEQEKEVCVEKTVTQTERPIDIKQVQAKQSPPKEVCPAKQTPFKAVGPQAKQSPPKEVCLAKQTPLKEVCPVKQTLPKEVCEAKQSPAKEICPVKQSPPREVCPVKSTPPREVCPAKKSTYPEIYPSKQTKNTNECKNMNSKIKNEYVQELDMNIESVESQQKGGVAQSSLASEVAKARQLIKNSLQCMDSVAALAGTPNVEIMNKINSLEKENKDLKKTVEELRKSLQSLKIDFETFTTKFAGASVSTSKATEKSAAVPAKDDSDDGVDLFGSDDEEESAEAAKIREERLAAYNAKKSKKPVLIAKSNIILDVKPWDDETDMKAMEAAVRAVACDGLLWGAAKLVPLAYGIHKLQISCVVEDDKVSIDWLTEELEKIEDYVQSVDIAAFNKV